MRWIEKLRLRIRSLLQRTQVEQDLNAEFNFHLEQLTQEYLDRGLNPKQAREAALCAMGDITQHQEECRDMRRVSLIEHLCQDLQYAGRMLVKNPGFTAVAVATLALGIGANTAIFTLVDAALLKSLPVSNSPELAVIEQLNPRGEANPLSYPLFEEIRERVPAFSGVFAALDGTYRVEIDRLDGNQIATAELQLVSGEYFDVLGVQAAVGRTLNSRDNLTAGGHPVAVLSFWKRAFQGNPEAIGESFIVRKQVFSVVGVAPPEFFGEAAGMAPDIWAPLMMQPAMNNGQSLLSNPSVSWLRHGTNEIRGGSKRGTSRDGRLPDPAQS